MPTLQKPGRLRSLNWSSPQRQRREGWARSLPTALPGLTCGAGDGHKGCRVKAALESVQLPFCGGPSETQAAWLDLKTERRGQLQPFRGAASCFWGCPPPRPRQLLLRLLSSTDVILSERTSTINLSPSSEVLHVLKLSISPH